MTGDLGGVQKWGEQKGKVRGGRQQQRLQEDAVVERTPGRVSDRHGCRF